MVSGNEMNFSFHQRFTVLSRQAVRSIVEMGD